MIWIRSSVCESASCVEVARDGSSVLLRNSAFPDLPPVRLSAGQWRGLLGNLADGLVPWFASRNRGGQIVVSAPLEPHPTRLTFTVEEWAAFTEGVLSGDFAQVTT